MYSVEEIRENYKGFSNSKIENIAKNESKGLRKDVLGILKDEIETRNLDINLINWVETETKSFDGIERDSLITKIQNLNCPKCSIKKDKLYGFEINQIVSVLLFANDTRKEKILCLNCGKKAKLKAILITFFAGWWSRRGIFLTPFTVLKDSFNFLFIDKISDRIINRVIDENTGHLRRKGTENKTLNLLIKRRNQKEILED
ncbi:hypothetical protein [uncultured Lacinutrix sp.]|uniref:hypothetical protein n=1 Tax=uncultured Lacinutrix sp. TaxID=574032 RepID=UPI002629687C|nr:hypothetical protein [uncultured Lacinutrix sp.]